MAPLLIPLHDACRAGDTERVRQLLDEGAQVDEKDKWGRTALMLASLRGHTEVVRLLLGKGAALDEIDRYGNAMVPALATLDEDELGRLAAAQVQGQLLKGQAQQGSNALDATATAVLQLVHLAGFARERALKLRSSDPRSADDHQALFGRLQLAAAACVQNNESGKDRGEFDAHKLLGSVDGRKALEHAVQIEAKELLAQPVVQGYIKVAWREYLVDLGWWWVLALLLLLLQLLFLLPLVVLVPALEPWQANELGKLYFLRLPAVKFGLECAADLALALALTLIPAADLATAPVASLLLVWVGSGLLWEARQVMTVSSDAKSRLDRMYDRFNAYWGDSINRVDATALIFSFAALVAFVSTNSEDATAASLRAVAVFLLWLRAIRVLLISPKFGPYVLMFFRMLFGDVLYFLVLLGVLLVAFAASWTVLLEPDSELLEQQYGDDQKDWLQKWRWTRSHAAHLETAGSCADELGGPDVLTTLQRLVEGALTGNDFFVCARDSTKSPLAAWAISLVFVTLTSVLLLNMLIAMMAKTFDNISDASATNYLFLFAQRTLALQNEPPTPPPLNALGLPCKGVYLLWKWVQKRKQKRAEAVALEATRARGEGARDEGEDAGPGAVIPNAVGVELPNRLSGQTPRGPQQPGSSAAHAAGQEGEGEEKPSSSAMEDGHEEDHERALTQSSTTFAQEITPLAEKITEYINDHQDDAAQEDRWRTVMKRETMKRFREQREAINTQCEASNTQGKAIAEMRKATAETREAINNEREAINIRLDQQREEVKRVKSAVQKLEAEMQSTQKRLEEKIDEVHLKMDAKMDQLIKSIKN